MSTDRAAPDLIFVTLIHRALRADGDRLVETVGDLKPEDRNGRLPRVRAFYTAYRQQLVSHHTHEDNLFFPALVARVGEDRMHLLELTSGHQQLDGVLEALDADFAALEDPNRDFSATRKTVSDDLSTMVEKLNGTSIWRRRRRFPSSRRRCRPRNTTRFEAKARKATPREQSSFMIPWLVEHASPDQRRTLFRSAPLRIVYLLTRRRYRRLDGALARLGRWPRPRFEHANRAIGHLDFLDPVGFDSRASETSVCPRNHALRPAAPVDAHRSGRHAATRRVPVRQPAPRLRRRRGRTDHRLRLHGRQAHGAHSDHRGTASGHAAYQGQP
jgi:hypothetical protein